MTYLIYDCEIIKCIPQRDCANDARFDYCDGWHDHGGMGISVIGVATSSESPSAIVVDGDYEHLDIIAFEEDAKHLSVVGFNSRCFDDLLLLSHNINVKTDYDILEEVRIAAGFAAHWQSVPKGFSYKLDAIARANGMAKTGNGELAPVLWQQGKRKEVIDYCLMDVRITRSILELGLAGKLVDPNTGKKLQLRSLGVKS
jgi:hypothetical protein